MGTGFIIAGGALLLAAMAFGIVILVKAFKQDVAHGFLCLCVPFYIIGFAFVRFEHPRKWLLVILWLATGLLGGIFMTAGIYYAINPPHEETSAEVETQDMNKLKQDIPKFPDLPPIKKEPAKAAATPDASVGK